MLCQSSSGECAPGKTQAIPTIAIPSGAPLDLAGPNCNSEVGTLSLARLREGRIAELFFALDPGTCKIYGKEVELYLEPDNALRTRVVPPRTVGSLRLPTRCLSDAGSLPMRPRPGDVFRRSD